MITSKWWVIIRRNYKECIDYTKRCELCQSTTILFKNPLSPSIRLWHWPFKAWGLNVMGPIIPKSSTGNSCILWATNHCSKWAEVILLREDKKENVANFIQTHIIHRYGMARYIITSNGKPFVNRLVTTLCLKFKFAPHKSSMYSAHANGLAKMFNKILYNRLSKVLPNSKQDWHERL